MRLKRSSPKMMHRAAELRKQMSPAEKRLWKYLRADQLGGVDFRRQHAIGRYVVDFCSPALKIVVEIDGSPHLTSRNADHERTAFLESKGYRVLRFWNGRVMNDLNGVLIEIKRAMEETA